jgi:hypothetical protein
METTVSNTETPIAPVVPVTQPTEDVAAIKAQLTAAQEAAAENKRVADYWYEQRGMRAPEPVAAPEPEPEDDTDILDVLTTQGVKGFDALLAKRGFVRAADVDARVNSKAAQLTAEADLINQYPDLRKRDSAFFVATARHYGDLTRQGVPEAVAMRLAAERAETDGIRAGTVKTPAQIAADAKTAKEATRLARIAAQAGDRTSRTAEVDGADDDDTLTAHEKHICAAMGISEESYIARAKAGVQMSSRGKK